MPVESFLIAIPPILVYVAVGLVIGIESFGVPLPGEIILVTSALLSSQPEFGISPWGVAIGAATGAIIGDSIGYAIGRRFGKPLFERLGRRFPKHFGPHHVLFAERVFTRYGVYAVFFGRFVALLRILAGPLAGALKMQYGKFLAANVLGGIAWAGGTTAAIYSLGIVAEVWLKRFSWIGLLVAILGGLTIGYLVKRKTERMARRYAEEEAAKLVAEEPTPAGGSAGA
jgi:membrane protein DedA with SNARE-associated domain